MQTLAEIPRALGIPNDAIQHALISTINDPSATNPFADLLTDMGAENGTYVQMLASLVNGQQNGEPPPPSRGSDSTKRDLPPELDPQGSNKRQHMH
jgi:hypothetical protein